MKFIAPLSLAAVLLGAAVANADECVRSSLDIFIAESARENLDDVATYKFCEGAEVAVGQFDGDQPPPLSVFNPKVRILCGERGEVSGNCVVDVGNAPGMPAVNFQAWSTFAAAFPAGVTPPEREDTELIDVEIHGMTFRGVKDAPIIYANVPMRVTFKDCLFLENESIGAAVIMDSQFPTAQPSTTPSAAPSTTLSAVPSAVPTTSQVPSLVPSSVPTSGPSISPKPSSVPSVPPTLKPTSRPSPKPSLSASESPSNNPTSVPSVPPTSKPTSQPSPKPSSSPSESPSNTPTVSHSPTLSPLDPGRCDEFRPCTNEEFPCCSRRGGSCGNGPEYCKPENCISGCWLEGEFSDPPTPVPVPTVPTDPPISEVDCSAENLCTDTNFPCCGKGGFCGNTYEWCSKEYGCQSGCYGDFRRELDEQDNIVHSEMSRRAETDKNASFDLVFDGCVFQGNTVVGDVEGSSAFISNIGGNLVVTRSNIEETELTHSDNGRSAVIWSYMGTTEVIDSEFRDNSFPDGGTTALIANEFGDVSVQGSCFRGSSVLVNIANFAITGANYLGENNYGDLEDPGCNGVGEITEGDLEDPASWVIQCLPFDADDCPLDLPSLTSSPTKAPTSKPSSGFVTQSTTPQPSGAVVPQKTSGARSYGCSSLSCGKITFFFVVMMYACCHW